MSAGSVIEPLSVVLSRTWGTSPAIPVGDKPNVRIEQGKLGKVAVLLQCTCVEAINEHTLRIPDKPSE